MEVRGATTAETRFLLSRTLLVPGSVFEDFLSLLGSPDVSNPLVIRLISYTFQLVTKTYPNARLRRMRVVTTPLRTRIW